MVEPMGVWYEPGPYVTPRARRAQPSRGARLFARGMTFEPLFPDDLDLVRRVQLGEADARLAFLERARHIVRILGHRNRRLGAPFSSADLADLAQETFVQVWGRLESYRGDGSLEAWFYRFCCNVMGNALQRRPRRMVGIVEEPGQEASSTDFLEDELLAEAVDELAHDEAVVVRMKLLDGLTFEELALRLGISSNTAKTRYYRGLEGIRRRLESRLGQR